MNVNAGQGETGGLVGYLNKKYEDKTSNFCVYK